jgi:uncharacterized protein (TIGR03435 family)
MKTLILTLLAPLLVLGATDVSGTWTGTINGPIYLVLKQDGSKLSGTAGPSLKEQALSFENGKVEADRIVFEIGPYAFDLQADGETLKGQAKNGEQTMRAFFKRPKQRSASDPPPGFEVASVKPSPPPSGNGINSSMNVAPGRVTCTNVSLRKLIVRAYGMKDYQFSGPDWLNTEIYDITATMPVDTSGEDMMLMMQTLLTERFKLVFHRENKEMSVLALVAGKTGSKLKPVEFTKGSTSLSPGKFEATSVPLTNVAEVLSRHLNRPVLDMTGLKGVYNFTLQWTQDSKTSAPAPGDEAREIGPSLYTAIQEQLGLKLEPRKAPVEMLVVDHAEKVPTGN